MRIQILGDDVQSISEVRRMLCGSYEVTAELLNTMTAVSKRIDAVIARVDLSLNDNILALKAMSLKLAHIPKRIFLLDRSSRLSIMQAYALGATAVIAMPTDRFEILSKLVDFSPKDKALPRHDEAQITAQIAAAQFRSAFSAILLGDRLDIDGATRVGLAITERVAEDGLCSWIRTVRAHHEGTYQHCLLVTGVTADFGLKLGLSRRDLDRVVLAAVLHDIGKAVVPVSILEKPGRLDDAERAVIETHPVAGFGALRDDPAVSAEVLDAVRHHHEFLDGSGYPDRLSGACISDLTRLLTISDIFSALIERRSYRAAMPPEKAFAILKSMNGKLEMALVDAFKEIALMRPGTRSSRLKTLV